MPSGNLVERNERFLFFICLIICRVARVCDTGGHRRSTFCVLETALLNNL